MSAMDHTSYSGSGPSCYANCLAMMLGEHAPSAAVIEFSTCSAFGMQLVNGGGLPSFDPFGWTPTASFDFALKAMGWESTLTTSRNAEEALSSLKLGLRRGPVFVSPVDIRCLSYLPNMNASTGLDRYVVVLGIQDDEVRLHDPQGYPHATLPVVDFIKAWRCEGVEYGKPYTMRTHFRRVEVVSEDNIIRRSIPNAEAWHAKIMDAQKRVAPGTASNREAAETLAKRVEEGCDEALRGHLVDFAIRVGARRAADAATCLRRVGHVEASEIMGKQAKLIGSLQYDFVVKDGRKAATTLRELGSTYEHLGRALLYLLPIG